MFRLDGVQHDLREGEFVYHENLIHPAATARRAQEGADHRRAATAARRRRRSSTPSVESVTMVEIDGDVIEVAKTHFHAVHQGVFDNPKLRGLNRRRWHEIRARDVQEKFDLIALDLNDPMGPAEALYSTEFFQQLRQGSAPGGALTLHIGSPWWRPERVAQLAQRLNAVFRIVRPYTMYIPLYGSLRGRWRSARTSSTRRRLPPTRSTGDRGAQARGFLVYYNGETHEGVFALPNFVRDLVIPTRLKWPARGRRLGVVRAAAKIRCLLGRAGGPFLFIVQPWLCSTFSTRESLRSRAMESPCCHRPGRPGVGPRLLEQRLDHAGFAQPAWRA